MMTWKYTRGDRVSAALSCSGDYVISHRPGSFTVSYRPTGEHVHVATRTTLVLAKKAAEGHKAYAMLTKYMALAQVPEKDLIALFGDLGEDAAKYVDEAITFFSKARGALDHARMRLKTV